MALLVIDNRPLQEAAWEELCRARKRLEKATRDIHRHELTDEPGFRAWLTSTFPTLISAVREFAQQVAAKARIVETVEEEAYMTQRSPAAVWRAMKDPARESRPADPWADDDPWSETADASNDRFDAEMKRFFEREGIEENDPVAEAFRDMARGLFGQGRRNAAPEAPTEARAIYRRLVQRLHPDRGGEWTPARARLWEQVQDAWNAGDADWLARLEAEWEASADLLGPASALGRLRAACREMDAARRDAERRVRIYRKAPSWRFSISSPSQALRDSILAQLRRDEQALRMQLEDLEAAIARWERPQRRRGRHGGRSTRVAWQDEMPLF